ncbi:hypothetical protein HAX54_000258, partial [Datura stramonium]|nr:hypothetical protein [Datura stramonium]
VEDVDSDQNIVVEYEIELEVTAKSRKAIIDDDVHVDAEKSTLVEDGNSRNNGRGKEI